VKLVIYTHYFAPSVGGVETYSMLLAAGLSTRNSGATTAITVVTNTAPGKFDDSSLPFTVIRQPGWIQLFKLIHGADLVHVVGPSLAPLCIAFLLRKPFVIEHHAYQGVCPNGLLLHQPDRTACPDLFMQSQYGQCLKCNAAEVGWFRSFRMLMLAWPRRWFCRQATVNMSITEHVARRVRLPRATVVYYGVPDFVQGDAQQTNSTCVKSDARLTVGYVGRLVQEKGISTLIEASHTLQQQGCHILFRIIGDGPERAHLEKLASAKGVKDAITFTGMLTGEALRSALNDVDVLVLPSLWEEPAGLVVMEQLMRGRPVIVSDNGGAAELAGDAGLKFPPGDAASLAKRIKQFADNPSLIDELGRGARKRALENFTQGRMVDEHREIFAHAIRDSGIR
jgi:glycosyltransferase involved in cell wall biosynthesis